MRDADQLEAIKNYYGRVLSRTQDLKTSACCSAEPLPPAARELLCCLHPEVKERFYGCGSPFPPALTRRTVLDLGCGAGRDAYLLSKLVGPDGRVIGVDMTDEQLAVARQHLDWHMRKFGYATANVEFVRGYIEDLAAAGVEDESVDLVVSNCVINLSPDKHRVFEEIFRVLRPGGELYFSDVYADRRIPSELVHDPELCGECLAGALYTEDLRRLLHAVGCADVRTVSNLPIALGDEGIRRRIGMVGFSSITVRAFKLPLEDRGEDYGQIAVYKGTLEHHPHVFELDERYRFETDRPQPVCGNTADMLSRTRYAPHFELIGDKTRHFGPFRQRSPASAPGRAAAAPRESCC